MFTSAEFPFAHGELNFNKAALFFSNSFFFFVNMYVDERARDTKKFKMKNKYGE